MQDKDILNLKKLAKTYSAVLSTPLIPLPRINFIKNYLKDLPFSLSENNYSLIVKVQGKSSKKLVFMSHLDHPGIVLKNRHQGICLGSLFPDRLEKIISQKGFIPLDIYTPQGKKITQGKLIGLKGKYKQKAILDIPTSVPTNSVAYYKIGFYKEDKDTVSMYAADNDVPTICMLNLLKSIKTKPSLTLYFVFTFFEEVHQISSFNLAKNNTLQLTKDDLILNLECKKIENDNQNPSKNKLTYHNGPVLQPSEIGCIYGYKFRSQNQTESLVKHIAEKKNIPFQYGLGLGSTDARPFSNFNITANICTLDVPNPYKHNCDENGKIVLEKIYKKDISAMYHLIQALSEISLDTLDKLSQSSTKSLSQKCKQNDTVTNKDLMKRKIFLNYRLDLANKIKFISKKYYQTNALYIVLDYALNLISYPYYFLLKTYKKVI